MSMAQLFLTNPVIIFHPPILSGAAVHREYSTFPNDRDIFLRGKFQRRFFFQREPASVHTYIHARAFLPLFFRFLSFLRISHLVPPSRDDTRSGRALTSLVFPVVKGGSVEDAVRNPRRPLLRFKQTANDGAINFDYAVETSEGVERARVPFLTSRGLPPPIACSN